MKIRRATVRDAKKLCDFMHAMRMEAPPTLFRRDTSPSVDEERAFIEKANRRGVILIALDGMVLGMIGATIPARAQRSHTCEFGMSVLKGHRGCGIGTQLLQALEAWARKKALRRIECAAFSNNVAGIRLYRRLGYRVEGRRRRAVEVAGRLVDLVELGKLL